MNQKEIEIVPITEIHIANPRTRNKQRWNEIVSSIRSVGLKKPITVSRRTEISPDGKRYDLVCGQGRIEAFLALGEIEIPAIVIEAPREDRFLMSLVENIARRPPSNRDILREVKVLRSRGYSVELIAEKIGFDRAYIHGLVRLIEHGEESLVAHVEAGKLPISVAVDIASGNDHSISRALSEAYQNGQLRGSKLKFVRRLVAERAEKRRAEGKEAQSRKKLTGNNLVQIYQQRVREQKTLVSRYEKNKARMALFTSAMRVLMSDENFVNLLRAESLIDMPEALAARLR
jgi:ParB family transcriptional regulator, chromosome partitioning protein